MFLWRQTSARTVEERDTFLVPGRPAVPGGPARLLADNPGVLSQGSDGRDHRRTGTFY